MARALVEVNLHKPLVERISYSDTEGNKKEIEVSYPWLPSRCSICHRWGHKGQDCVSKEIKLLHKSTEEEESNTFAPVPQEVVKASEVEGNVLENLIQNLEAVTPRALPVAPSTSSGGEMIVSWGPAN